METYNQGDLADIIRASGGSIDGTLGSIPVTFGGSMTDSWQFLTDPVIFGGFGNPFTPSDDIDMSGGSANLFSNSNSVGNNDTAGFCAAAGNSFVRDLDHQHQQIKQPNNYFSRILQIAPNEGNLSRDDSQISVASLELLKLPPSTLISSNGCMISANSSTGLHNSSPRSTGINRRKNQVKKVVCVPAPTPANSRPTGEIVPSDLWAWRKYGQKPIKGSPYPRGYYRCSSSKGCSARKQVERSRTDSNMLVITYTSEHNHPWPTQRNALAGSTRNQPASNNTHPASKTSPTAECQSKKPCQLLISKEQKEDNDVEKKCKSSTSINVTDKSSAIVKVEEETNDKGNKLLTEMEDYDQFSKGFTPFESYKLPTLPGDYINHDHDQDFFADLAEIESADPLNLLFIQGFDDKLKCDDKTLDPFTFIGWTGNRSKQQ